MELPLALLCPITFQQMNTPFVSFCCGKTFEKYDYEKSINGWSRCPGCNTKCFDPDGVENRFVYDAYDEINRLQSIINSLTDQLYILSSSNNLNQTNNNKSYLAISKHYFGSSLLCYGSWDQWKQPMNTVCKTCVRFKTQKDSTSFEHSLKLSDYFVFELPDKALMDGVYEFKYKLETQNKWYCNETIPIKLNNFGTKNNYFEIKNGKVVNTYFDKILIVYTMEDID
jgi:hypothetical protein